MTPHGDPRADDPRVGMMGFGIFLASLSMLFAASMVAYLVIRVRADAWPPPGMPSLPDGLWIGTALLLLSSGTVEWAKRAIRAGKSAGPGMAATWLLGIAFLVAQVLNWSSLLAVEVSASTNLYGFTFFTMTGLHGLHVIGGLLPMALVAVQALRGAYTPDRHRAVTYSAVYWHFLAVVWLVMFSAMVIAA
jgi:cytochrome c oxidase subunit III